MTKPEFTEVYEQTRTYHYAQKSVTILDVFSINVSPSGTHRINTTDGKKYIMSPGWLYIEFDAEEWTF